MKKAVRVQVFDHEEEVPCKRPVYKIIKKEVNCCDICGQESDRICLGCGRVICYFCDQEDLEIIQLWVGTQEEYGDNYHIEPSDDFDTEHFYICQSCKENPPEKIKFWNKQKEIESLEEQIKKLNQEMIKDVRKIKKMN